MKSRMTWKMGDVVLGDMTTRLITAYQGRQKGGGGIVGFGGPAVSSSLAV